MSWLARSIANSILIDGQDHYVDDVHDQRLPTTSSNHGDNDPSQYLKEGQFNPRDHTPEEEDQPRTGGVKEDLSEFTESLTRQLWGVASLLAPPPPPPPPPPPRRPYSFTTTQPHPSLSVDADLSDSAYNESRFGGGNGVSVSSNFPIDKEEAVIGVTEEALAFARNIAHHPETWLDFPLSEEEEEDNDDFEMSDTQWNHVTLIEHLAPRLAALRIELCPIHMSESYFWKVYFVLLHPRLNRHDADLLSTPQIVAARGMWMKELQKRNKPEADLFVPTATCHTLDSSSNFQNHQDVNNNNNDDDDIRNSSSESPGERRTDVISHYYSGDAKEVSSEDDWVHENSELDGYDGPDLLLATDEDISFSDLERSP